MVGTGAAGTCTELCLACPRSSEPALREGVGGNKAPQENERLQRSAADPN